MNPPAFRGITALKIMTLLMSGIVGLAFSLVSPAASEAKLPGSPPTATRPPGSGLTSIQTQSAGTQGASEGDADQSGQGEGEQDEGEEAPPDPIDFTQIDADFALINQSPYVAADGEFRATLEWTGPIHPELTVSSIIRGKLEPEASIGSSTSVMNRVPAVAVPELHNATNNTIEVSIPIRSFTPGDADRIFVREPGVYPIDIELRDSYGLVASIQTHLIRLPTEIAEMDLASVAFMLTFPRADSVDAVIEVLAAHPTTPVSVYLDQAIANRLLDRPQIARRLAQALGNRELVFAPEFGLDPSALARIGQGKIYAQELDAARAALVDVGLRPSPTTIGLHTDLTDEGAELLASLGYTAIVNPDASTSGHVLTSVGPLAVIAPHNEFTSLLHRYSDTPVRSYDLIAMLALRSEQDHSPVLIGGAVAPPASLGSSAILLDAIGGGGLIEPLVVSESAASLSPRRLQPIENPAQDLLPIQGLIVELDRILHDYESFWLSGDPDPADLRRDFLAALSTGQTPIERQTALQDLRIRVHQNLETVTIRPNQAVTLTATNMTVPLTIDNAASGDRQIRLRFDSDRVEVAEHDQIIVVPPGPSIVDINVETRSIGVAPLNISIVSPQGEHTIDSGRLQIRSTAVPGLGLLLSGAALTFLVAWWIISITGARRERRSRAERTDIDAGRIGMKERDTIPDPDPSPASPDTEEEPRSGGNTPDPANV